MEIPDIHCTLTNTRVVGKYNCTLNQTNIAKNNNKFYILQILTDGKIYYLWTRYGRVGDRGVGSYKEFNILSEAEQAFRKTI